MNWYTVYWLHGERSVICGVTIEDAFVHAGYSGGAVNAVDWYNVGVSETHWYNKEEKKWVEFEPINIHVNDIDELVPNDILAMMSKHHIIQINFESKDMIVLQKDWGKFYLNNKTCWVEYVSVSFGEYFKGTYGGDSDDEENEHHFMMAGTQYFAPADVIFACECLLTRAKGKAPAYSLNGSNSKSMEDIHVLQKIEYTE